MKQCLFLLFSIFALMAPSMTGCAKKPPQVTQAPPSSINIPEQGQKKVSDIYDKYKGPWRKEANTNIESIFEKEGVTTCKNYSFKRHQHGSSYLVKCTDTKYYIVWVGMQKASGPYQMRKSSIARVNAQEKAALASWPDDNSFTPRKKN